MKTSMEDVVDVELDEICSLLLCAESEIWTRQINSACQNRRELSSSSLVSHGSSDRSNSMPSCAKVPAEEHAAMVIRKGNSVDEIHNYFFGLNPRRNIVETQTQPSAPFRTIQAGKRSRDFRSNIFSRKLSPPRVRDRELTRKEEDVYKHALLCTQSLVLCGPGAPPTISPQLDRQKDRSEECLDRSDSTGDTGYESPDNISIEQEALFSLLRSSFGVNIRVHRKLMADVRELTNISGGRMKLLLKDLWDHRLKIEYNDHKFYKARAFKNVDCYGRWRLREIAWTDRLIEKVTGRRPTSHSQGESSLVSVCGHEEYEVLQNKLFRQEMKTRKEVGNDSENYLVSPSVISTASKRLLKEFSLRYGIGVPFRKVTEFCLMVRNFEFTSWFMSCTMEALNDLMTLVDEEHELMVKEEMQLLQMAVEELHDKLEYTLIKIKSLCPKILPYSGVTVIIELLRMVLDAKIVLGLWDEEDRPLANLLQEYVKNAVRKEYTKSKEISACDFTSQSAHDSMSPKLLRRLLQDIREIMRFFFVLNSESRAFESEINLPSVVAKALYDMFMLDVKQLCVERTSVITTETVDVEMFTLAYRIAQLDREWAAYIKSQEQKWRTYYVLESRVIMKSVADYVNSKVKEFLLKDSWRKIVTELDTSEVVPETSHERCGTQCTIENASPASLIPSETSAFSSIGGQRRESGPGFEQLQSPLAQDRDTRDPTLSNVCKQVYPGEDEESSVDEEVASYSLSRNREWQRTYGSKSTSTSFESQLSNLDGFRHFLSLSDSAILRCQERRAKAKSSLLENGLSVRTDVKLLQGGQLIRSKSMSCLVDCVRNVIPQKVYAKDDMDVRYLRIYSILAADESSSSPVYTFPAHSTENSCSQSRVKEQRATFWISRTGGAVINRSKSLPVITKSEARKTRCLQMPEKSPETNQTEYNPSDAVTEFVCCGVKSWANLSRINRQTKLRVHVTSSVIDLLVAIKRFCSVTEDLVGLLVPPHLEDVERWDMMAMYDQLKHEFCDRFFGAVSDIMMTYAHGILALDLCGTGKDTFLLEVSREVLVQILRQRQRGLVPGCRHDPRGLYVTSPWQDACPTLQRIKKFFPAEWEPVTTEMCNRINNVSALKDVLLIIQNDVWDVLKTRGQDNPTLPLVEQIPDHNEDPRQQLCPEFKACEEQLSRALVILTNCVAFRTFTMYQALLVSLFSLDLPCIKYICNSKASFGDQVKPVCDFLASKSKMFKDELSHGCAVRVVKELWRMILEDLHSRITDLSSNMIDATYHAKRYIIIVPLLLKAIDVFDENEVSAILVEKSKSLLSRAELYTLNCSTLMHVYDYLDQLEDVASEPLTLEEITLHLRRRLPRSFTGKDFTRTLSKEPEWLRTSLRSCGVSECSNVIKCACKLGKYLLFKQVLECKKLPRERRRQVGEAFFKPSSSPHKVVVVDGKMLHLPLAGSDEGISGSARPQSTVSFLSVDDDDPQGELYDSSESEYVFIRLMSSTQDVCARVTEVVRENSTMLEAFRSDIKNVLRFRCLVKRDNEAEISLREIDPDFNGRKPICCPCV